MIYLDHNSTTYLHESLADHLKEMIHLPFNASSVHTQGRKTRAIIDNAKDKILRSVGLDKSYNKYDLIFTSSATEANNLILNSFRDDIICVAETEHASVRNFVESKYFLERTKTGNLHFLPVSKNGLLKLDVFENTLNQIRSNNKNTRILIVAMLAHNETGVIQPINEILSIANSYDAFVHSDMVQVFGKMPLELDDLDLDFASISSHKIGAGHGAAALIYKKNHDIKPMIIGGGQERSKRAGTENIFAIKSFAEIMSLINNDLDNKCAKMLSMRNYLEEKLCNDISGLEIVGKDVLRLPNTTMIINPFYSSEIQLMKLDINNIMVSNGSACSSGVVKPSRNLIAMGYSEKEASNAIRISNYHSNNIDEIDKFIEIYLKQCVSCAA